MTDTTGTDRPSRGRPVRRRLLAAGAVLALAGASAGLWGMAVAGPATPSTAADVAHVPGSGGRVEVVWSGGRTTRVPLCGRRQEPGPSSTLRTLAARDGNVVGGREQCIALAPDGLAVVLRAARLDGPGVCLLGEAAGPDLVVSVAPPEVCTGFLGAQVPKPLTSRGPAAALPAEVGP